MRLIQKDGIPHWWDGALALPVMAGGQDGDGQDGDGKDYSLDDLAAVIAATSGGGGGVRSAKGMSIIGPNGELRYLDVLSVPGRKPIIIGYVTGPDGKPQGIPIQPGLYQTPLGSILNIDEQGMIVEERTIPFNQWTGGGGGSTRNFAAEQAAADAAQAARDEAQRKWQAEQDEAQRKWQENQNRIAAEEARRQSLLSTATQLLEGRRQSRDIALSRGSELAGEDIFRFLANVHQKAVPQGTMTPIDVFKAQNAQIATAQAPTIGPDSTIGDLESAISKMTQMQQEEEQSRAGPFAAFGMPASSSSGFAYGGSVSPAGIRFGTTKRAVLLGDKTINGDEEIGIYDAARGTGITEVIPLAGGAETGAEFQTPEQEWKELEQSLTVLPQLFQTLRRDVGGVQNQYAGGLPSQGANLSGLGYLSPAQAARTGATRFGQRGALAEPLRLKSGLEDFAQLGLTTPEEAQRLSDLVGILPAPHKAARYLRGLLPSEAKAVISAYRLARFPTADLEAVLKESMIAGPARTGVSLR